MTVHALLQEWQSTDGAQIPIQCVMDVVGNAFNSNAPAELPVAYKQLMPLIQTSRRGPAIDLDAFLLVMLEEHLQGMQYLLFAIIAVMDGNHACSMFHTVIQVEWAHAPACRPWDGSSKQQ